MSEDLTPRQQILLWDLVSRGGSALQKDLKPAVTPKDRDPLVRAKMISFDPKKRPYRLVIEDAGWNRLSSVSPTLVTTDATSHPDRMILQFILTKLQTYAAGRTSYLEIFSGGPTERNKTTERDPTLPVPVEDAIRSAFFEIAGRPARDGVRLRRLRGKLPDISRADLDTALVRMRERGRANLMNLDNPRDIEAEGDAALKVGDQTFHLLWIDS